MCHMVPHGAPSGFLYPYCHQLLRQACPSPRRGLSTMVQQNVMQG